MTTTFEGGLLLLFFPMISWYLSISLWDAFMMGNSYKLSKFIMSLQSDLYSPFTTPANTLS
uniref:chlorhexidine efflux transporter n=1 Tax=uncultured Psychrobacter sp. TaxID=259303 RepID=UPI002592B765|nr:chlorhexidine efflux transporter [uncultured Psychrobacter sp.]